MKESMNMTAEVVAAPAAGDAGAAGVVVVTLRNTGRLNAMSRAMWRQLRSVFESIQRNPEARCVLIEGADGSVSDGPAEWRRAIAAAVRG